MQEFVSLSIHFFVRLVASLFSLLTGLFSFGTLQTSRETLHGSTGDINGAILSRLFQYQSDGMVGYNQARKIAYVRKLPRIAGPNRMNHSTLTQSRFFSFVSLSFCECSNHCIFQFINHLHLSFPLLFFCETFVVCLLYEHSYRTVLPWPARSCA